jgi:hypothetical protein
VKKHLIILIVAVLLLVVGLCGCNNVGTNVISIREINQYPNKYINETVTVKASCAWLLDSTSECMLYEDEQADGLSDIPAKVVAGVDTSIVNRSMVINKVYFYWKGIVRYDTNYWDHDFGTSILYIEVSEIKPV